MRTIRVFSILAFLVATQANGQPAKKAAPAKASTPDQKFKAIWKPVNFGQDLSLNDIACLAPEQCWVAGGKGTILYTADGGKNWQVQLGGDPASTDEDLVEVFFLDAKTGWARGYNQKLLHTRDGSSWMEMGKLPSTGRSIVFTSPQTGFELDFADSISQGTLRRSADAGKTWSPIQRCEVQATMEGLARRIPCVLSSIVFTSPRDGHATGLATQGVGYLEIAVYSRTTDGGNSWNVAPVAGTERAGQTISFWSPQAGLLLLANGLAYWTADAGNTWTGSITPLKTPCYYASGDGKFVVGIHEYLNTIAYSVNGGRSFTGRRFPIPAKVKSVVFPDARHGYLVGEHGMAYRYRIVPIDYSVPGMIGALAP